MYVQEGVEEEQSIREKELRSTIITESGWLPIIIPVLCAPAAIRSPTGQGGGKQRRFLCSGGQET